MAEPTSPSSSRPNPFRRPVGNGLRLDLYRHLYPEIIERDQKSGNFGYVANWDDPESTWDSGDPSQAWDALGFRPVIETLFYVIESMAGEEIGVVENLDALVDPYACPVQYLPLLAASLGYDLEESIPEEQKRAVVQGLVVAYKARGQEVGFRIFYRMAGFKIIRVFPLWKKNINEDREDYSRVRYSTTPIVGESIGPGGALGYTGRLASTPIEPGSIRMTDGVVVIRDDPVPVGFVTSADAPLIGPGGITGTVNYFTGAFRLTFPTPSAGPVVADYATIVEEWPFHAARIDIEVLLNPGGTPVPLVDEEVVRNILGRAEETRPVHVLLRTLALITELRDVGPTATDRASCTTQRRDRRPGAPELGIDGRDYNYFLDGVGGIGDDVLVVDQVVGGTVAEKDVGLEDQASIVCPLDVLIIEAGGPPTYW